MVKPHQLHVPIANVDVYTPSTNSPSGYFMHPHPVISPRHPVSAIETLADFLFVEDWRAECAAHFIKSAKMVCPMMNKRAQAEAVYDYPYEAIYRPWSWMLSSSANLLLFAALVGLLWVLYKRRRAQGRRRLVSYRSVDVNKSLLESEGAGKVNALVTGGNGTLGKEIVRCLIEDGGYRVFSLDLFIPGEESRNSEVCSYIEADITNFDDLRIATKGMDVVFHSAAIVPTVIGAKNSDFDDVNLKGTENVIAACKECKVKRLVYTSSVDVVLGKGEQGVKNADEDHPLPQQPLNAYIRTKGRAEEAVLSANGDGGLSTCAVRPGGILEMMMRFKVERPIYIGEKGRDFPLVSGEDVAKVQIQLDKLLSNKSKVAEGKVFILSTNTVEHTVIEAVANELNDGRSAESFSVKIYSLMTYVNVIVYSLTGIAPFSELITLQGLDFVKLKSHTFSSARAERELGWKPTPWKDTVKKLVKEWKETKKTK